MDKTGIQHIFTRHHPTFWDGSVKTSQSFIPRNWGVNQVEDAISTVMKQNQSILLLRTGNMEMMQIKGTYSGLNVTVGFKNGKIGQFYTQ